MVLIVGGIFAIYFSSMVNSKNEDELFVTLALLPSKFQLNIKSNTNWIGKFIGKDISGSGDSHLSQIVVIRGYMELEISTSGWLYYSFSGFGKTLSSGWINNTGYQVSDFQWSPFIDLWFLLNPVTLIPV
ncbi:MAG: hypothetical protein HWN67_09485 [Candidatus Helarchaeota archaeon]|nr:hypothetical protein [Candidatus Helarchaeota archaeon]